MNVLSNETSVFPRPISQRVSAISNGLFIILLVHSGFLFYVLV
jgi:hypothetical protein